jgi:hypothetical protein
MTSTATPAMTRRQRDTVASLTIALDRLHHDGALSFTAETMANGVVLLSASNVRGDLRWFEQVADWYGYVGPRGSVRKYAGSIHNPWSKITTLNLSRRAANRAKKAA